MLILERRPDVYDFVKVKLEQESDWENYQTIGWEVNGSVTAGVVFTDYTGANIVANIAANPGIYMRDFICGVFRYAFIQLGCRRVTALCAAKNEKAHEFVEFLGFKREGYMRHGLEDDDIVLYGILKEDCSWLKGALN